MMTSYGWRNPQKMAKPLQNYGLVNGIINTNPNLKLILPYAVSWRSGLVVTKRK